MKSSLTLGKVFGIPIGLNVSWFLVAALITFSLAASVFPQQYPGWSALTYWLVGGATAVLFFGSVLLHELGHSVVALRERIPVRGITLFIFGGVAQIEREPETPGAEFRIAIAGPLTSVALGLGFLALHPLTATYSGALSAMALYLGRVNLALAVFNMIPGFPLDGGRVLRSILWRFGRNLRRATRWASNVGRAVAFVFIGLGVLQVLVGDLGNGLWTAFIGWFLNNAAQSSYQQVVLQEMLSGVKARDVAPQRCPVVPGDARLDRLVIDRVLGAGEGCFFVGDERGLQGMITLNQIRRVPRDLWQRVTANQVMTPAGALAWAQSDDELLTLLRRMEVAELGHLPIMDGDRPLGMITRQGLLAHIRLRSELGL